jgi:hypothetical protein
MIQNIKEMNTDELQCVVYEHIEKLMIRYNQHSDESFKFSTTDFVIDYLKLNACEFTKLDLENIFSQIGSGEIKNNIQNKGVNTNEIIECIKIYQYNQKQLKKGIYKTQTDIARSSENMERVKESLKKGIIDVKAFYSLDEYKKLDVEFARRYDNLVKNASSKFNSNRI